MRWQLRSCDRAAHGVSDDPSARPIRVPQQAATPACVAVSLDDRIGQAAQIATDLLPEAGDSELVEAGSKPLTCGGAEGI
jgi:hypothetical protein